MLRILIIFFLVVGFLIFVLKNNSKKAFSKIKKFKEDAKNAQTLEEIQAIEFHFNQFIKSNWTTELKPFINEVSSIIRTKIMEFNEVPDSENEEESKEESKEE